MGMLRAIFSDSLLAIGIELHGDIVNAQVLGSSTATALGIRVALTFCCQAVSTFFASIFFSRLFLAHAVLRPLCSHL